MRKTILLAMSVMLFWSCNNPTEQSAAHQETENHTTPHPNEDSEAVELNLGERWLVNEEMKPFVSKGEELVNKYIQDGKSDPKMLADQLKDQNNQLIKSCTMEGKS